MINDDILAHARQCAPAESCGYVVRTAQGERYFRVKICLLNPRCISYIPGGLPECPEPRRHRGAGTQPS